MQGGAWRACVPEAILLPSTNLCSQASVKCSRESSSLFRARARMADFTRSPTPEPYAKRPRTSNSGSVERPQPTAAAPTSLHCLRPWATAPGDPPRGRKWW